METIALWMFICTIIIALWGWAKIAKIRATPTSRAPSPSASCRQHWPAGAQISLTPQTLGANELVCQLYDLLPHREGSRPQTTMTADTYKQRTLDGFTVGYGNLLDPDRWVVQIANIAERHLLLTVSQNHPLADSSPDIAALGALQRQVCELARTIDASVVIKRHRPNANDGALAP